MSAMSIMGGSILITGGTGYLAHGIVRRLLSQGGYERICLYSRGEYAQARMREEFSDSRLRWFIGDVRDRERLTVALDGVQCVIHAAALKRIEVGAYNPDEMLKTNVMGSRNVIAAARSCGVAKVLLVSSDKAFEPVSPYGQTKALAESLFLASNQMPGPRFAVCRYGNVAGSTGSVIPTWRALLERGADRLPVTDPDCTRFYMTLDEAVALVLDTLATMEGGEFAYPQTMPAYRVGDMARAFGVEALVTGLRAFEKLHEGIAPGITSDLARRMDVEELRECLATV